MHVSIQLSPIDLKIEIFTFCGFCESTKILKTNQMSIVCHKLLYISSLLFSLSLSPSPSIDGVQWISILCKQHRRTKGHNHDNTQSFTLGLVFLLFSCVCSAIWWLQFCLSEWMTIIILTISHQEYSFYILFTKQTQPLSPIPFRMNNNSQLNQILIIKLNFWQIAFILNVYRTKIY